MVLNFLLIVSCDSNGPVSAKFLVLYIEENVEKLDSKNSCPSKNSHEL